MSSLMKKRKRGRPRVNETQGVDNLDISIIHEYRKRAAFYDRNNPQYSKREYLEPLWREMALVVGQNVNVVKTRILQLRNRYNLEKRRVESLQTRYDDPQITSAWPLFKELSFLQEHIKSRGYYTNTRISLRDIKMSPQEYAASDKNSDEEQSVSGPFVAHPYKNKFLQKTAIVFTKNPAPLNDAKKSRIERPQVLSVIRNVGTSSGLKLNRSVDVGHVNGNATISGDVAEISTASISPIKLANKFTAIGQFLGASLLEMDEQNALRLVEKFTSDIVQSLIADLKPSIDQKNNS